MTSLGIAGRKLHRRNILKQQSNFTDTTMAVSRRILTKHLEPARPLHRITLMDPELVVNAAFPKAPREDVDQMNSQVSQIASNIGDCTVTEVVMNLDIEQFHKTVSTSRQKQGRLTYTRDFIIGLANCPAAREMPQFLPDHPIVLTKARDLGHLWLHELLNPGEEETAEGLHSA